MARTLVCRQSADIPAFDRKLIQLRDRLRVEPLIPQRDLEDLLQVLIALANLMSQAVQDARFPSVISEFEFQKQVRAFLRQYPNIGVGLEEKARAAGGETDLSFKGIRIELKSEKTTEKLLPADCERYARQAASYVLRAPTAAWPCCAYLIAVRKPTCLFQWTTADGDPRGLPDVPHLRRDVPDFRETSLSLARYRGERHTWLRGGFRRPSPVRLDIRVARFVVDAPVLVTKLFYVVQARHGRPPGLPTSGLARA